MNVCLLVSPLQCLMRFLDNICSMMETAFFSVETFSTCSISQRTASAERKEVGGRGGDLEMKDNPGNIN